MTDQMDEKIRRAKHALDDDDVRGFILVTETEDAGTKLQHVDTELPLPTALEVAAWLSTGASEASAEASGFLGAVFDQSEMTEVEVEMGEGGGALDGLGGGAAGSPSLGGAPAREALEQADEFVVQQAAEAVGIDTGGLDHDEVIDEILAEVR